MNNKIVILGSSGHAKVIAEILESLDYEIVGFIDSFAEKGKQVLDYQVLGDETMFEDPNNNFGTSNVVIAVGDNHKRALVHNKLLTINKSLNFPAIISPFSTVSSRCVIGEGTVIMSNVVINCETIINEFCLVNTSSVIEHECTLDSFSSLAPGVILGGNVLVKEKAFVGIGSTIIQKRTVGKESVVAAGSTVVKDVPLKSLVAGSPAVVKKQDYSNDNLFA